MVPGAAEFLALGAVIVATAGLLILGLAIGYRLGLQAALAPANYSLTWEGDGPADAPHDSADAPGDPDPIDLMAAIEQLNANARRLADQLGRLHPPANPVGPLEATNGERLVAESAYSAATGMSPEQASSFRHRQALSAERVSDGWLTAEEMQSLGSVADAQPEELADNSKRRYPYHYRQFVRILETADSTGPSQPVAVWCHDISVSGISFFWPEQPQFERLIISVGQPERPILMQSEVMQSKVVYMHGEVRYLLGCRFTGRVDLHGAAECQSGACLPISSRDG
jgi:hypothetical protein